jgi:hypothetical protein
MANAETVKSTAENNATREELKAKGWMTNEDLSYELAARWRLSQSRIIEKIREALPLISKERMEEHSKRVGKQLFISSELQEELTSQVRKKK